jgi:hypothetical protein
VGARISAPLQTGPGDHPVSYTMDTESFLGVKRPGRGADHPPHLAPRLKEGCSYTSTPPLCLLTYSRVSFAFTRYSQLLKMSSRYNALLICNLLQTFRKAVLSASIFKFACGSCLHSAGSPDTLKKDAERSHVMSVINCQ